MSQNQKAAVIIGQIYPNAKPKFKTQVEHFAREPLTSICGVPREKALCSQNTQDFNTKKEKNEYIDRSARNFTYDPNRHRSVGIEELTRENLNAENKYLFSQLEKDAEFMEKHKEIFETIMARYNQQAGPVSRQLAAQARNWGLPNNEVSLVGALWPSAAITEQSRLVERLKLEPSSSYGEGRIALYPGVLINGVLAKN